MRAALYVDSSAVVKRFRPETGSEEAIAEMSDALALCSSRITYIEVGRAISSRAPDLGQAPGGPREEWRAAWADFDVIDLDQAIAEHATSLAAHHGLRSADAIHLASALAVPPAPLRFATWDQRLWDAARAVGLRTVPSERP